MLKFIALDCETGGLDRDRSLLTAYFHIFDHNFDELDSLELKIRPDEDGYFVNAEALNINKINLVKHHREAIKIKDAKKVLYDFLYKNHPGEKNKLIPVGQNVNFDIQYLQDNLMSRKTWDQFVSYHAVDTASLALVFKLLGHIDLFEKTRLSNLARLFDVQLDNAHDAKSDTLATVGVLKEMLNKLGGIDIDKRYR